MLSACGDSAQAPPAFARLDLVPGQGAAPLRPEVSFARFEPATEADRWTVEAAHHGTRRLLGTPEDSPPGVLFAQSFSSDVPLRYTRKGRYDPARFNVARVGLTVGGNGLAFLRLELRRQGEMVVRSEPVVLTETAEPQIFEVDFPAHIPVTCSELVLEVTGGHRNMGLLSLELLDRPLEGLMPDVGGPAALVAYAGETRRAEGITDERPAEATFIVPPNGRLTFSHAAPFDVRRRSSGASRLWVSLAAADDGADPGLQRDFKTRSYWEHAEFDLSDLEGRRLTARFEVVAARRVADDGRLLPDRALEAGLELPAFEAGWAIAEAAVHGPDPAHGGAPPTVLLITSDTHRGDHVGYAPDGVTVSTPTLDGLAARGLAFDDCFSPTNVTNPSHIALMTGHHPRDTGVLVNRRPVTEAATTLAEHFQAAGYVTQGVLTTRHLGHVSSGLGQGFDRLSWPEGADRSAAEAVDMALQWRGHAGERPLFLWLHLFDAHTPYTPIPAFDRIYYDPDRDPFDPDLPDPGVAAEILDPIMPGLRDVEFAKAQYKAEVSYLDAQLGRLLADARFGSGLVSLVGDHGEGLGESGVWFGHDELYPGTVHVPMLLAGPGVAGGGRVEAPVTHLDLGRTLLDLAGLTAAEFPGRSLLRFTEGRRQPSEPRFILSAGGRAVAVQSGPLYLVMYLSDYTSGRSGRTYQRHQIELFDIVADRVCAHDLAAEQPQAAAGLRALLIEWMQSAQPLAQADTIDEPALLEQLAQLGYIASETGDGPLWVEDDCEWCRRYGR